MVASWVARTYYTVVCSQAGDLQPPGPTPCFTHRNFKAQLSSSGNFNSRFSDKILSLNLRTPSYLSFCFSIEICSNCSGGGGGLSFCPKGNDHLFSITDSFMFNDSSQCFSPLMSATFTNITLASTGNPLALQSGDRILQ